MSTSESDNLIIDDNSLQQKEEVIKEIIIDENDREGSKWIVVQDIDHKKYNELLHEIECLKSMIIDLHTILLLQNEGVDKSNNNILFIKEKINSVNCDINAMKTSQEKQSRFGYIRDYVFPAIGMVTVNYPIFWLAGPKTGIMASTLGYMLWKFT